MRKRLEKYNEFMKFVWELNTLVNETHEGRCLSRQFRGRGPEFLNMIQNAEMDEDQRMFLNGEFDLAIPRLTEGVSLMNGILETLNRAKLALGPAPADRLAAEERGAEVRDE